MLLTGIILFLIIIKKSNQLNQQKDIIENEWVMSLLISKRYRILRHAVLLITFFAFLYSAIGIPDNGKPMGYIHLLSIYFGFVAMFYINIYLLVPLLFFRGRYFLYLFLLALTVFCVLKVVSFVLDNYVRPPGSQPVGHLEKHEVLGLYTGSVICIAIILVTTTFKLFGRWIKDREKISELNTLTLNMELDGLRNQINPHFLFNMLNNVKALVRIDPEKAAAVIIKLSEFLRYQLYENGEAKTSLQGELNFLNNLVELEKIRRDHLIINIAIDIKPEVIRSISLPPNLFTTFIENAIKYSFDINGSSEQINIKLSLQDQILHFKCANSKGSDIWKAKPQNRGLGFSNINRRLELLYKDDFVLNISSTETSYIVDLKIPV
jgi:sensor histidine kinase YesM